MLLPAYALSSGLGSKLSTWLTPPQRKIQMTALALGVKGAVDGVGAARAADGPARATPSRNSIAPRARPVKPMPVSTRNDRRETPGHPPSRAVGRWRGMAGVLGRSVIGS